MMFLDENIIDQSWIFHGYVTPELQHFFEPSPGNPPVKHQPNECQREAVVAFLAPKVI